jgi:hypothetical protein
MSWYSEVEHLLNQDGYQIFVNKVGDTFSFTAGIQATNGTRCFKQGFSFSGYGKTLEEAVYNALSEEPNNTNKALRDLLVVYKSL